MFFGETDLIFWKMEDFPLVTASLYFPPFFFRGWELPLLVFPLLLFGSNVNLVFSVSPPS